MHLSREAQKVDTQRNVPAKHVETMGGNYFVLGDAPEPGPGTNQSAAEAIRAPTTLLRPPLLNSSLSPRH